MNYEVYVTDLKDVRAAASGGATKSQPFFRQHRASEVTCVSVYSGVPQRALRETFREGSRIRPTTNRANLYSISEADG